MMALERFEAAIAACHRASAMHPSDAGNEAIDAAMELATNWLVEFEDEIRAALDPRYSVTEIGRALLAGVK